MSSTVYGTTRWTPETPVERDLVVEELNAILASYHFRGSKRYPALLKYVVDKTLEGHAEGLKERTLGVEVFERQPDYDTNADPVVRISASEIRKRIAQYYHENRGNSRLQIDLPLGSYVPEFKPRQEPVTAPASNAGTQEAVAPKLGSGGRRVSRWWIAAVLPVALSAFGAYSLNKTSAAKAADKLWSPLLRSPGSVLIVVGTSHPDQLPPEPAQTSLKDHMVGPYHHVTMSTAIALSRLAGVLQTDGRAYEIKEDTDASLTDFRSRPVILVGAMNNLWTLRLTAPLRFHFVPGTLSQLADARNPGNAEWVTDVSKPFSSVSTDYALLARYHDATTNGTVMIIGGLGPYGTEAASEFVASPHYLDQLLAALPRGWENKNIEIVLKGDVINGEAGPPHVVSYTTW